jgi:hypothetical protein
MSRHRDRAPSWAGLDWARLGYRMRLRYVMSSGDWGPVQIRRCRCSGVGAPAQRVSWFEHVVAFVGGNGGGL